MDQEGDVTPYQRCSSIMGNTVEVASCYGAALLPFVLDGVSGVTKQDGKMFNLFNIYVIENIIN